MSAKKTIVTSLLILIVTVIASPVFGVTYDLIAPLPGGSTAPGSFPNYVEQLIAFLLSAAAILAAVMIVIGGIQYLASAGNPSKITEAKSRIGSALLGLLLAIAAWLILNTINPELTILKLSVPDPTPALPGPATPPPGGP